MVLKDEESHSMKKDLVDRWQKDNLLPKSNCEIRDMNAMNDVQGV